MKSAYTPEGWYIGLSKDAYRLCYVRGIKPELRTERHSVCSIGFCEKENKWYGWSHRAIYGFGIGSTCEKGDVHYAPRGRGEWAAETMEDAKQMAMDFAEGVS